MNELSVSLEQLTDDELRILENALVMGDLSALTPRQRIYHYKNTCLSMRLNPLSRPFDYIRLSGKLVLYANKNSSDQLRYRDNISIKIVARETIEGVYVVTAAAKEGKNGRVDESTGAVSIKGLQGEALANAFMKAETKAKRRVTLSIAGLSFIDESELEGISSAERVSFDLETGEILDDKKRTPSAAPTKQKLVPPVGVAALTQKMTPLQELQLCVVENERKLGFDIWMKLGEDKKKVWSQLTPNEKAWVTSLKPKEETDDLDDTAKFVALMDKQYNG